MSYLYKKPVPKNIPAPVNEIVVPSIPEKADIIGNITEISYEEHLKNLELMCKKDREFMKRVREFCEEHKEKAFNVVQPYQIKNLPVNTREGASDYLYLGKPIKPLVYLADTPYIIREEPAKSILEHLGAYQLIEKYFPKSDPPGLKD